MARAGASRGHLQQMPANFHYTDVQILVRWLDPMSDALPCDVKKQGLIKNSVLGSDKHVTAGQHVHMDASWPTEVSKLRRMHTKRRNVEIKHRDNKTSMRQLVTMCLKCVHMLVSMCLKFSFKLSTYRSSCWVGSS